MSGEHHLLREDHTSGNSIGFARWIVGRPGIQSRTHGIDYIPENERWATPRNIGALWTGSAINVEYFIYGALLMGFGFSFYTALSLIIIGNLSYFLLGPRLAAGP